MPLTVLDKEIVPGPALLFKIEAAPKVIGWRNEIPPAEVVIFAEREFDPAPFWVKVLPTEKLAPDAIVKVPLFVRVTGAAVVAVTVPLKFIVEPVRTIPEMVLVFRAPLNVMESPVV